MTRMPFVSIVSVALLWMSGTLSFDMHRGARGVTQRGVRGLSSVPTPMRSQQQERFLMRK